MIWALLAAAIMALTLGWMIHLVNNHQPHPVIVHVGRAALVPAGIVASAGLFVHALMDLQNGLPL